MISLKNIKKTINEVQVLTDISIDISRGDFYVICCQNGGGKTTIVKLMSKLIRPDKGDVIYDDIDDKDIAVVYDDIETGTQCSTFEYLTFYGRCYDIDEKEVVKRVEYYLSRYNKDNLKYLPYDDLSRSDKKIICMISALVADSKVIICDEPYKHVFEEDKGTIRKILDDIKEEKTIIATCDNLDDYVEIATKVAIIDRGSIIICGDIKDALIEYGYKNYLEVYYDGDIDNVATLLKSIDNIKEYTYTDKKIDIVTYDYGKDHEILKMLIDNGINISSFRREEKK